MKTVRRMLALPWVPPEYGRTPYLWAFALLFMVWPYALYPAPALELAAMGLTVAVFLPLYFASFWLEGRRTLLAILVTCLLAVLWAPHNGLTSSFFIYAAGMCAGLREPKQGYLALGAVVALGAVAGLVLADNQVRYLIPALAIGIPVGLAALMDGALARSRNALLRAQEEVAHMATIAERERISRDLHDLLGHTLSLITLKAELAGKLAGRDLDACRREIADIETSARNALAEVRSAVTGYRLTGLAHELAGARASLAAAGITLTEQVPPFSIPAAAENVMALALREAVTNIIRHAGATRCTVSLARDGGALVLRVADNGVLTAGAQALRHGNGLTGMKGRAAAIGGRLALRLNLEQGLALELRLPAGGAA